MSFPRMRRGILSVFLLLCFILVRRCIFLRLVSAGISLFAGVIRHVPPGALQMKGAQGN